MSSFSTPYRDVSLVTYIVLLVNQHEYFNVVQFFFTLWWSNNFVWDNLEIFPAFTKLHQDKTSRIRNYSWQNCPRLHIHFEFWAPHISNDFLATIFSMVRWYYKYMTLSLWFAKNMEYFSLGTQKMRLLALLHQF